MSLFIQKISYYLFPRSLRRFIVKSMIGAEQSADPREATKWLLGIYDFINYEIDSQCKRWGDGVHIKHEVMDGIHSFFYERIEKGDNVLDLGCGYGALAHAIAVNADARVLAIDFDAGQIEFGKKRFNHPNIQFAVGDVFKDIPKGGTFDTIVLSSVLEHLKSRPEFLKDLTARFKPKKFLIRVPTFERHLQAALKKELGLFPYTDDTHELEYSKDIFYEEMKQAGLEVKYFEIRWADIWAECIPAK
ncbi:MAG: class I SAM-dependent methyltransferase [Anaerolineaceae bacterium]|jgi:ubiquinone/menaquinone biosynthesis C-methylase UbiE|nr:MAG: class I SAM-dependent methyltransferase [Anaerolineaceae bacterium]